MLQLRDNRYVVAISSLPLAYSPWASFGMMPIAVAGTFCKGNKVRNAMNSINVIMPLIVLVVTSLFCNFLVFIFLEAGIYFCILGEYAVNYRYYGVVVAELLYFPLFYFRDNNFVMRGSIPALFLLMIFVTKFLCDAGNKEVKYRKIILIAVLAIGGVTPFTEINRALRATLLNNYEIQEQV